MAKQNARYKKEQKQRLLKCVNGHNNQLVKINLSSASTLPVHLSAWSSMITCLLQIATVNFMSSIDRRWACCGVYAWHRAISAATVGATVGAIMCQNSRQPHCWPWVSRYIRGQQYNIRLCRHQKDRMEALPWSKMPQRGQAAAFPELERQLVE